MPLHSSITIVGIDGPQECPNSTCSEKLRSAVLAFLSSLFVMKCGSGLNDYLWFRDEPKEGTSFKIRKKVSFNLNVQTYEPISTDDHVLQSDEEDEEMEKNGRKVSRVSSLSTSATKRASTGLISLGLFPSNYRYQNVRDSYDSYEEEDYLADEESDLDDDDYDGDDDDYNGDSDLDDQRMSQEGFPKHFYSSSINGNRDNIPNAHSVLSPIENLSQWKAAKAKAAAPKPQKENIPSFQEPSILYSRSSCNQSKPLLQEIPVHASLSSWINSTSVTSKA